MQVQSQHGQSTQPNQPNQVGGNGSPNQSERSCQIIAQELVQLRTNLDHLIARLPNDRGNPPALNSHQAIKAKFEQALKDQHNLSHGNLIESMKKQHDSTQKALVAQANLQDENDKKSFNEALSQYFSKRLELARAKLQEVNNADKHTKKAQKHIISQFRTEDGKTGPEVLQKLGSHGSIVSPSGNENETVKFQGGVLSSGSPTNLANTAKSLGWQSFKFTQAKASYSGANKLIDSVEAMLRVGIKQVEIHDKLMEKMLSEPRNTYGHSSGDYAAQLAKYLRPSKRNVSDRQKDKLRQLRDICAASTAAYKEIQANPVFDADGNLKPGNESTKFGHQAETFMRLTTKENRKAYLKLLYPKNTERYYAAFTKELERRGKKFPVGNNQTLSPKEYFEQELLWKFSPLGVLGVSRSQYQTNLNLVNDVATFEDPATTTDARKDLYAKTTNEKSLRQMVKSEHLDSDTKRNDFANAVFDKANERKTDGNHTVGLYTHPVTVLRYVTNEDKKHFINKMLPLFTKMSVTNSANNNRVDFSATLQKKSALLSNLRSKAEATYKDEKAMDNANKPTAFNNYYKNKLLLDALEEQMLQDHQQQILQALMQREQRQPTEDEQRTAMRDTLVQHLESFTNIPQPDQKAGHFVKRLSPFLQQQVWASLDNAQPDTAVLRAHILKQLMDLHNQANSPAAMDYLKDTAKSLLARLDDADKTAVMARLAELCLNDPNKPIVGCDRRENRALHALRDLVPTPAAQPLLSTELFKQYYRQNGNDPLNNNNNPQSADVLAGKLLQRIQCYAAEKPAHFVEAFRLNQKFDNEMRDLLYPNDNPNPHSDEILDELQQRIDALSAAQAKTLNEYVSRITASKPASEEAVPLQAL